MCNATEGFESSMKLLREALDKVEEHRKDNRLQLMLWELSAVGRGLSGMIHWASSLMGQKHDNGAGNL